MGSPRLPSRLRFRAGFSLFEALAALALTGLLFATGLPLFVQLVEHWSAGTARSMAADERTRVTSRLSDDLAQVLPPRAEQAGGSAMGFLGFADRIDFVRTSLGGKGHSALEAVSLMITRQDGAVALVRIARPFSRAGVEPSLAGSDEVTLSRVRTKLKFSYLDSKGSEQESWDSKAGLPSGVALRLGPPEAAIMGLSYFIFPVVAGSP
jgi:hypothetical protein